MNAKRRGSESGLFSTITTSASRLLCRTPWLVFPSRLVCTKITPLTSKALRLSRSEKRRRRRRRRNRRFRCSRTSQSSNSPNRLLLEEAILTSLFCCPLPPLLFHYHSCETVLSHFRDLNWQKMLYPFVS